MLSWLDLAGGCEGGGVLELTVDRGHCQGARECVRAAPASFRIDDTVTAVPIQPAGDPDPALFDAARSCPNSAIRVFRDGIEVDVFASEEEQQ
jgi:ferredoxin